MNTCKVCGKGYCESRVRRIFGKLNRGYCSPQCFTKVYRVDPDDAARTTAGDIFDKLYEYGFINDANAVSDKRFAEAVELMLPILKGEGSE